MVALILVFVIGGVFTFGIVPVMFVAMEWHNLRCGGSQAIRFHKWDPISEVSKGRVSIYWKQHIQCRYCGATDEVTMAENEAQAIYFGYLEPKTVHGRKESREKDEKVA